MPRGGNRRPQTFRDCACCQKRFGPLDRLSQKYCSVECKVRAQTTGRITIRKTIPIARAAQRTLRYHIESGKIARPDTCEQCGTSGRIEGAHFNYMEPLLVRWLCRSCHVKWDKADPKHATVIVARWERYTGQKASLISGEEQS